MHQISMFGIEDEAAREKYHQRQEAVLLKGMNLLDAATTRERNHQIGGHKSGE